MKRADLSPAQGQDFKLGWLDHAAFCRESLSIRNLGGSRVPFELSPGQLALHEAAQLQRKRGMPVRLVVLKTRRSFFTSGACAEMFHEVPFMPGKRGLVIADKYKPAGLEAFDYLLQFQRHYKPFERHACKVVLPELIKDSQQVMGWANGSSIEVLSAEGGEVRGGGRHHTLCDEVAFWRNPEMTLTGVLNMVPKLAETSVVVQSTANGVGGEFYDLVRMAMDPLNASGWLFVFFGWLGHPPYRIPLTDEAKISIQNSVDQEEWNLIKMHGATLEQLAWRRSTIATECRGDVDTFHQEYPTTPEDAFIASGRPALDHKALSRMPVRAGMWGQLQIVEEPLGKRLLFQPGDHGALTVWERPQRGRSYVIGADPSKGIDVSGSRRGADPDYSVAPVIDRQTGIQVAQLRERIRPVPFAESLAHLGRWYNYAYLVPEANDAGFIDALVRTSYPLEQVYRRQRDPTDRRAAHIDEIGFETTTLTRAWLIAALEDAIREMSLTILSPIALQECRTFVVKPNGKQEHQTGCHDDCVLALALCAIGMRYAPRIGLLDKPGPEKRKVSYYGKQSADDDDDKPPTNTGLRGLGRSSGRR